MTDKELWDTYYCGDQQLNSAAALIMAAALKEIGYDAQPVTEGSGLVDCPRDNYPSNEALLQAANLARVAIGLLPIPDVETAQRLRQYGIDHGLDSAIS